MYTSVCLITIVLARFERGFKLNKVLSLTCPMVTEPKHLQDLASVPTVLNLTIPFCIHGNPQFIVNLWQKTRIIFTKETGINELTLLVLDNAVGPGILWLKSCELYILVEIVLHEHNKIVRI